MAPVGYHGSGKINTVANPVSVTVKNGEKIVTVDPDTANFHPCIKDLVKASEKNGARSTLLEHVNINADIFVSLVEVHLASRDKSAVVASDAGGDDRGVSVPGRHALVTSEENDHETSPATNKHRFPIVDLTLVSEATRETEVVGKTRPMGTANNLNPGEEIIA